METARALSVRSGHDDELEMGGGRLWPKGLQLSRRSKPRSELHFHLLFSAALRGHSCGVAMHSVPALSEVAQSFLELLAPTEASNSPANISNRLSALRKVSSPFVGDTDHQADAIVSTASLTRRNPSFSLRISSNSSPCLETLSRHPSRPAASRITRLIFESSNEDHSRRILRSHDQRKFDVLPQNYERHFPYSRYGSGIPQ